MLFWDNSVFSMWSFHQVYLCTYWSNSAFPRTLYLLEHSLFCYLVYYPLLIILTRNTESLLCQDCIPQIRRDRGRPLWWWVFSCVATGDFHLTKSLGISQVLPVLLRSSPSAEQAPRNLKREPWCLLEKVVNSVDQYVIAGEVIIRWFIFMALV